MLDTAQPAQILGNSNQKFPTEKNGNPVLWSESQSKKERTHPVAESTAIPIEEAEAVKVADRIMEEYYEIEERIFKMESIEATQFLVDTLKRVITDLGGESLLEVG